MSELPQKGACVAMPVSGDIAVARGSAGGPIGDSAVPSIAWGGLSACLAPPCDCQVAV